MPEQDHPFSTDSVVSAQDRSQITRVGHLFQRYPRFALTRTDLCQGQPPLADHAGQPYRGIF